MASPVKLKYINKLEGTRVLVFGGTSGLGFSVAEAAVEHGAYVVITGSNQERLDKAVERLRTTYDLVNQVSPADNRAAQPTGKVCDLTNEDGLETNLESLLRFATSDGQQPLNHVVYTAGDSLVLLKLQDVAVTDALKAYLVRVAVPTVLGKLLALPRHMHQSPTGSYTVTSGVNAEKPLLGSAIVAGVSAAGEGLARGLAVNLKPVRVNCVAPGAVHTEMFDRLPDEQRAQSLEFFRQNTTTGVIGRPEDLAEAYLYCMKDSFVTGSVISSNGGALLV